MRCGGTVLGCLEQATSLYALAPRLRRITGGAIDSMGMEKLEALHDEQKVSARAHTLVG